VEDFSPPWLVTLLIERHDLHHGLWSCEAVAEPKNATQRKGKQMPLINIKLLNGVFTPKQKQEMIRKVTDTMVAIEGENMRPVTWVIVEEVESGNWGVGGNPLTAADVHAMAAGK
jgi:4-oxalocrotonate tautomerase